MVSRREAERKAPQLVQSVRDSHPEAKQSLAKGAVLLFAARIGVLGINFGAAIIVARNLGPSGRGTYGLVVLVPVLLAQTLYLGLQNAAVFFVGRGHHSAKNIASTLFWSGTILGTTVGIAGMSFVQLWGKYLFSETSLLLLALASLPFLLNSAFLGHVLLGQQRPGLFAVQGLVQSIVLFCSQALALLWAHGELKYAVGSWVLSQLLAAVLVTAITARTAGLGLLVDRTFLGKAFRYGRVGYVGDWFEFMNLRLDQFLIPVWHGSTALGQYAVAVSLTEAVWQLPISVGAVLFARIAASGQHPSRISTVKVTRLTIIATLSLVLLLGVSAQRLVPILFGSAFKESVPALYLLLPGTVALVIPKVVGGTFYGQGRPEYVTYAAGISFLATIAASVMLIPQFGILGAALASSVSYCISAGYMIHVAGRVLGETWFA